MLMAGANFREGATTEVLLPRIPLPRTPLRKGRRPNTGASAPLLRYEKLLQLTLSREEDSELLASLRVPLGFSKHPRTVRSVAVIEEATDAEARQGDAGRGSHRQRESPAYRLQAEEERQLCPTEQHRCESVVKVHQPGVFYFAGT